MKSSGGTPCRPTITSIDPITLLIQQICDIFVDSTFLDLVSVAVSVSGCITWELLDTPFAQTKAERNLLFDAKYEMEKKSTD